MATLYRGYWPRVANRDAKYHASWDGRVQLEYWNDQSTMARLDAVGHQALGEMVNTVKTAVNGQPGGTFFLNEYGHVIVPAIRETGRECYYAGVYPSLPEFRLGDSVIGPTPPHGLEPGDDWFGPHVGIPYVLEATGLDIRYESDVPGEPSLIRRVKLSNVTSRSLAQRLAVRLETVKGRGGGRIYINEAGAFFAPVGDAMPGYRYLGMLDGDAWFPEPA